MHIAINTSPLSGGHSGRGVGWYTKELINALAALEPKHTYSFFTRISEVDTSADIIHYPFFDPFFLTMPVSAPKPLVVTVHDLIPIVHARHFPRGVRGEIKWQIQKFLLSRNAKAIITDSNASKQDIVRIMSTTPDRVVVVPLAPRSVFRKITEKNRLLEVQKKYKLNNKYVLYVGDVNWNKNVPGLLLAFSDYAKKSKTNQQLVLVGKAFLEDRLLETQHIRRQIRTLGLESSVVMPGFVPDEDLACLYSSAEALVCPSLAEGFGFPVLEAMACGCPVVTSNRSSLPEISGSAILVDPENPEDIRRGIDMVCSMSASSRKKLVHDGLEWVKKFTWKKVARDTMRVYENVICHHTGI